MPIWDEEWFSDSGLVRDPSGRALATFDVPLTEDDPEDPEDPEVDARAKLAAAAPAMARLLLSLEWPEPSHDSQPVVCHFCRREHPDEDRPGPEAHAPDCRWLAVMRAAGVRE